MSKMLSFEKYNSFYVNREKKCEEKKMSKKNTIRVPVPTAHSNSICCCLCCYYSIYQHQKKEFHMKDELHTNLRSFI